MTSRKDLAHLAATLAARASYNNAEHVTRDALTLARLAVAANRHATNLCNLQNYQAVWDKKKPSLLKRASEVASKYKLSAAVSGDPRGCCLKLFALPKSPKLAGNTWGGDEAGYGVATE